MTFLLDTNTVSEVIKPSPNPGVIAWLEQVDEDRVFVSVITLAELRRGVERLAPGARKRRLDDWIGAELTSRFEGRILVVDEEIADRWGRLVALSESAGKRMGLMDAFLAATAERHGLRLVTRNVRDFAPFGIAVLNPWTP